MTQHSRSTPGATAVAIAALALGIGLNILVFSLTSPVLVTGLPFPEAERLLEIAMAPPDRPEARGPITPALYALLRDKSRAAFEAVGVYDAGRTVNLAGDATGLAERVAAHRISATGLAALGGTPLFGRLPTADDEQPGAPPTIVLGYPLWQKRFGGGADIVGRFVDIDGQSTQVLAVMPEGFGLLDNFSDAYLTSGFEPVAGQETQKTLRAVGRVKPGVSMAEARVAAKVALDEYAKAFPTRDKGWTVELTPYGDARFGGLRRPLLWAQLAVGGILLIMCVSVAVLVSARAATARASAGPTSGAGSAGAVFTHRLWLALAGGAVGAVAVWMGLPALIEIMPAVLPRLNEVAVNATVLAFALALCVAAALVMGLVPMWRASRAHAEVSGGRGWTGWLGTLALTVLLAAQATLAFVLLAGAVLAIRAHGDLGGRDVGIDPSGLVSFDVHLPRRPYVTPNVAQAGSIDLSEYSPAGAAVYDRIRTALQTTPGVVQAAGVGSQPFSNAPFVQFFIDDLEHTPDNQVSAQFLAVTENYFNTMGIRLVKGRDFSAADQPDSTWVVLVNETLAKQQWPDGEAIGHRLSLTFHPDDGEPSREIVGVVADTLPFRGASEVPPLIYVLHRQQAAQQRASLEGRRTVMSFIARASGDPVALGDQVRALVHKVDPATPVASIRTVESYLNAGQVGLLRFAATLLGVFALVALATSTVGVAGVTAFGLARRQGVLTAAVAAIVGVVAGLVVGRIVWLRLGGVIESFLTNLSFAPSDPKTLGAAAGVLVAAALVAFVIPVLGRARAGR